MISGRDSASLRSFSAMGASRARRSLRTPPCGGLTMLGMGEIGVGQGEISISSTPIYIHFLLPPPRGWRACISCTCIKPVRAIFQDCAIETAAAAGKTGHVLHHSHVMDAGTAVERCSCPRMRALVDGVRTPRRRVGQPVHGPEHDRLHR